jgi:hypothetical protein
LILLAVFFAVLNPADAGAAERLPNIVFIMAMPFWDNQVKVLRIR